VQALPALFFCALGRKDWSAANRIELAGGEVDPILDTPAHAP